MLAVKALNVVIENTNTDLYTCFNEKIGACFKPGITSLTKCVRSLQHGFLLNSSGNFLSSLIEQFLFRLQFDFLDLQQDFGLIKIP